MESWNCQHHSLGKYSCTSLLDIFALVVCVCTLLLNSKIFIISFWTFAKCCSLLDVCCSDDSQRIKYTCNCLHIELDTKFLTSNEIIHFENGWCVLTCISLANGCDFDDFTFQQSSKHVFFCFGLLDLGVCLCVWERERDGNRKQWPNTLYSMGYWRINVYCATFFEISGLQIDRCKSARERATRYTHSTERNIVTGNIRGVAGILDDLIVIIPWALTAKKLRRLKCCIYQRFIMATDIFFVHSWLHVIVSALPLYFCVFFFLNSDSSPIDTRHD